MRLFSALIGLLSLTLLTGAERYPFQHQERLVLYVGKVETLRLPDIERVAVGNDQILATSLLTHDELLIIPQQPGETDLVVWQIGNRKQLLRLDIRSHRPEDLIKDARLRLKLYSGLSFRIEEGTVLISGEVGTEEQLNDVIARLSPDLIDQVRMHVRVDLVRMLRSALQSIPSLSVSDENGWISIQGSYPPEKKPIIDEVLKRCSRCVNSAQEDLASEKSMILVDVRIMEIRQRHLDRLGIRWSQPLAGPSMAMAITGGDTDLFQAFSSVGKSDLIASQLPNGFKGAAGSVGLITQFESQIDLLKESGEARMLARPMLSTRDGTPSSFHSGGEIPYPIIDARTGNVGVEFREYGVLLTVLPRLSAQAGISVEIQAEVSSVDQAIAINGVPGLVSKSVSSVVSAMEGETIVLSGLMSLEDDSSRSGLPWLDELPLVGAFFRSDLSDHNQRELAVFLTPHIRPTASSQLPLALDQLLSDLSHQFPEAGNPEQTRHRMKE